MSVDHVDRILEQWAAERPDLDVSPMAITGRITRIGTYYREAIQETFRRFDLNCSSFDLLATLLRSGPPYTLSPGQLLDSSMVTSGTMTNRIDRLEEEGLVRRKQCPNDKRICHVSLTDKGHALISKAVEAHVETLHALTDGISPKDQDALNRLLKKVASAFEENDHSE